MKPNPFGWLLVGILLAGSASLSAQPYAISTFAGSATDPGTADGTNDAAQFTAPTGVASSPAGELFVMDGNALRRIQSLGTNRVVQTLAGAMRLHAFLDGTNGNARFNAPQGVALDAGGNLYVADTYNNAIRKVALLGTNWVVTTIAGPTPPATSSGSNDGTNSDARFYHPYGITADSATNLYVADTLNHTIRKLTSRGTNWVVTTLAGSAGQAGKTNGTNSDARFNNPTGLTVNTAGELFVADFGNNIVRTLISVGTNWVAGTLAGSGTAGSSDGLGTNAGFASPQCLALDGAGNLFVTDSGNYTLRKISPAGQVTTPAGTAGISGSADGIGAAAEFGQPYGIAATPSGALFIADYLGYSIRKGVVAPLLHIMPAGLQVVVSWPVALTGCVLQSSSTLAPNSWIDQTNGVTFSGDFWTLTTSPAPGASFFRLRNVGP